MERGEGRSGLGLPYQVPQTEWLKTTENTFSGSLEAKSKIKMRAGLL